MSESERKTRLLYLEDDTSLARLLQRRLGRQGFVVETAGNGEDGLSLLESREYDAVIVDYRLPGMDGVEVLRALALAGRAIPAVMVTGAGDEKIAVEAMKLGAGDYVVKDGSGHYLDVLPAVLERIMETRRLIREKEQAERQLAEKTAILATTLANIDQGLSFFDSELRLVAWNDRYFQLFEFPPEMAILGTPLELFLSYNSQRGEYGHGDREDQVAMRLDRARRGEDHRYEHHRPDGHVIEVRGGPMPGGGFVATYTDITERKRAEQELKRSHELLDYVSRIQSRYIEESEPTLFFGSLLGDIIGLTGSRLGFIAEAIENVESPAMRVLAISDIAWNESTRELLGKIPDGGFMLHNLRNLVGAVIRSGLPVIANDPANDPRRGGLPEGHPPLDNFLGLPLVRGRGGVGLIGLANRPGGYGPTLVESLEPVLASCAQIIESYRVQRQRREAEDKIRHMASHDALTGLANRALLLDHLRLALAGARRRRSTVAVLFVDLDGFKPINDSLGHEVGDKVLKTVAERLRHGVRETDTVARYGGDEFVIVMTEVTDSQAPDRVAQTLVGLIRQSMAIDEHQVMVSASVGIATFPGDGDSPEELLRRADDGMYRVKQGGKDGFARVSPLN